MRDYKNGFPAFFPKSTCYDKIFLAGGILERVVMDTYFVFLCYRVMLFVCYEVDVGDPTYASLPMLGFEGVACRNTTNL